MSRIFTPQYGAISVINLPRPRHAVPARGHPPVVLINTWNERLERFSVTLRWFEKRGFVLHLHRQFPISISVCGVEFQDGYPRSGGVTQVGEKSFLATRENVLFGGLTPHIGMTCEITFAHSIANFSRFPNWLSQNGCPLHFSFLIKSRSLISNCATAARSFTHTHTLTFPWVAAILLALYLSPSGRQQRHAHTHTHYHAPICTWISEKKRL